MRFSIIALALLPIFNLAEADSVNVTSVVPTLEEMNELYPGVIFDNIDSPLSARGTNETEEAQRTNAWKFVAGSLFAGGYWSLGPGCDKVLAAYKSCRDPQGDGAECAQRAAGAGLAHILAFGAGFVGGRQAVIYFWHGEALQAAAPAGGVKAKRACNVNQHSWSSSTHFSGSHGLKIGGKDFCLHPDGGELGYVQALASQIVNGMNDKGSCALNAQFTIADTSSRRVVGRFHLQFENAAGNVCPLEIDGGKSCTA